MLKAERNGKVDLPVSKFIEGIAIIGFDPDEFNGSSVRDEKRVHSTPELGIDKVLPGTNLVIFGCGENVRVRVNAVP